MAHNRNPVLAFDAITIEGALLPAEWLAKVAKLGAPQQAPADYAVPKGLKLRDELGRYWHMAKAEWADYLAAREAHPAEASRNLITKLWRVVFGADDLVPVEPRLIGDNVYPITALALGGRLPIVIAPAGHGLDQRDLRFGDGHRQKTPFGLLQDYLNVEDAALWGLCSNGNTLRLARDNASLTRPAWIEADLERIFAEDRFADFSALWLLIHASRFGTASNPPAQCALEAWRDASREEGIRARNDLRQGVTAALKALGQGFLSAPGNEALRARLTTGELGKDAYFRQLLRLVYRCLFLLTIEERGLLHPEGADPAAVRTYREGYGLQRLRDRARRRRAWDRHRDLWQGLAPVWRGLAEGQTLLALPALGGLFAADQCPDLDAAELPNAALLEAVFHLGWLRANSALVRINWRDMGPEELGSIYESLLELVPVIAEHGRRFGFADTAASAGNERKQSGSYYTPEALVQQLLDSALEPVIAARVAGASDAQAALLAITVCDPACGSGHFLLAAARRLAGHLARVRSDGTPSGMEYRHALRDVITHCVYGVDVNPMALELARTALWLEAMTPDRPLGFLDHHLHCGDALLGVLDFAVLEHGLPDDAYKALTGDDKPTASALKKRNKFERDSAQQALAPNDLFRVERLATDTDAVERLGDDNLAAVSAKRDAWQKAEDVARDSRLARLADLYLGAFLLPKDKGAEVPTSRHLWAVAQGQGEATLAVAEAAARSACAAANVLHWWLAFPHIHAQGGFSVMLGNPPWERIKLQEQEFFASKNADIALAKNKAERGQRIQWLSEGMLAVQLDPTLPPSDAQAMAEKRLYAEFAQARRVAEAASAFAHVERGRYPLTGRGDVDTYALFAETFTRGISDRGRTGFIVKSGIGTDDTYKYFFQSIVGTGRLVSFKGFDNTDGIFPAVHTDTPFALVTIGATRRSPSFCHYILALQDLDDSRRWFTLQPDELSLVNPNTKTSPVCRSQCDVELTKAVYRRVPVLIREAEKDADGHVTAPGVNPWGIAFQRMLDMSNDSHLFRDAPRAGERDLPLYEAKMIHQFDHRWATYVPKAGGGLETIDCTDAQKADPAFAPVPRYYVAEREVLARIARVPRAVANAWLAWHKAGPAERSDAAAALDAALAAWLAGQWFLDAGGEAAAGTPAAPQARAAETVARRLSADCPALSAALNLARLKPAKRIELLAKCAAQALATPLGEAEAATLRGLAQAGDTLAHAARLAAELDGWMDARSPRWLMGWRDVTNATNGRTVIASVLPRSGVGNNLPLMLFDTAVEPRRYAALLANLSALAFDFVARQKVGGTHVNYFIYKQLPVLTPDRYTEADLAFIVPHVLELTYTTHDLAPWARDLGHAGAPFAWNPERRAQLRAELDAYYARLYGLTRDELRYILDPADVEGPDYPSETFRVLKNNDEHAFGEYRTRRLVLAAWDHLPQ